MSTTEPLAFSAQQREQSKKPPAMASAALPEAVEPKKKGNVRFAFACAILASMTSILLGYGTDTNLLLVSSPFLFAVLCFCMGSS